MSQRDEKDSGVTISLVELKSRHYRFIVTTSHGGQIFFTATSTQKWSIFYRNWRVPSTFKAFFGLSKTTLALPKNNLATSIDYPPSLFWRDVVYGWSLTRAVANGTPLPWIFRPFCVPAYLKLVLQDIHLYKVPIAGDSVYPHHQL